MTTGHSSATVAGHGTTCLPYFHKAERWESEGSAARGKRDRYSPRKSTDHRSAPLRWKHFIREEKLPGAHLQSDDELLDYARRNGGTCYHASCTCMMGQHTMAVVANELRVHGFYGLRIIDDQ